MFLNSGRNTVEGEDWAFTRIEDFSIFNSFDCGDNDLNEFIQEDALDHKKELIAITYGLFFTDIDIKPVAFASILNDKIILETNNQLRPIKNSLRKYPDFPAVKIGRLGVAGYMQRQGIGSIVLDILKNLFTSNNRTGCRFLTVDAYKNPQVITFYENNEFRFLSNQDEDFNRRIMYFDLKRYQRR